jgi:hypothetical protein
MAGVLLMATRYTYVLKRQIPFVLLNAIWRGRAAKAAAVVADLIPERSLSVLQGLSLITVGFILRTLPSLGELFDVVRR